MELPSSLFVPKIREFEDTIKVFQKPKSEQKIRVYTDKIRDFFAAFFIVDLLDFKKWDYTQEELFLSQARRKKISKEHFEYIRALSTTDAFRNFQIMLKRPLTPQQRRDLKYIQNFEPKKLDDYEKEVKENREMIYLDDRIKHILFNNLQDKYVSQSNLLPVKKIITDQQSNEDVSFRYIYFPKLLDTIIRNSNLANTLSWPPENSSSNVKWKISKSIFKQESHYTYENIYDAIWVTLWLGTYWYHDDSEKKIQIMQFLSLFPSMKFSNRQQKVIISQVAG